MRDTICLNVIIEGMKPMNRIILTCLFFAVFILERTVLFVSVGEIKIPEFSPVQKCTIEAFNGRVRKTFHNW